MVFFEVAYHLQGVRQELEIGKFSGKCSVAYDFFIQTWSLFQNIPLYRYTFLLLNPVSLRQNVDCFLLCGFPVLHQIQTWSRDLHSALFSAALFPPQTKLGIKGKRQLYAVRLHFIAKDSLDVQPSQVQTAKQTAVLCRCGSTTCERSKESRGVHLFILVFCHIE